MITRKAYPSDLSEMEWHIIMPYLPPLSLEGRPRTHTWREIINSIFYITRAGCTWRMLPHDLPPWKTVYHYFRLWRLNGLWESLNTALREELRAAVGREQQPSAGIIDSQSIKTTETPGERGYDGAKKVNGRKRHILVDTQGLLLSVKVHPANISEWEGAKLLLEPLKAKFSRLKLIWADGGYNKGGLAEWLKNLLGWELEIVQHPWAGKKGVWVKKGEVVPADQLPPGGFVLLRRRWVVERTFGWLGRYRRLSKDYEQLSETSESFIYAAMSRLMLRRLARLKTKQVDRALGPGLEGKPEALEVFPAALAS